MTNEVATVDTPLPTTLVEQVKDSGEPPMYHATVFPEQTVKKIATAISAVMGEVGIVAKKGYNEFHRYKYSAMEDVLRKITPLLAKHGLVIMQNEIARDMFDNGRCIAIKYQFTIFHTSGEVWPERPVQTGTSRCMDSKGNFDDKALNKAHTAARKYFLLGLFQIPTGNEEDDADREDLPRTRKVNTKPSTDMNDAIPDYAVHHDPETGEIIPNPIPEHSAPQYPVAPSEAGAPMLQTGLTGAGAPAETDSERIVRFDGELTAASELGTEELKRQWLLIPTGDRKALKASLEKRHKPRATEVDAARLL